MAKNFWFKFEWDDWLADEALSACSLEAQGLWLRCLCFMYRSEVAELTGTVEQLRRKLGVLPEELTRCLHDLKTNNAADVRFCNGDVSIISRRRQKDLKAKENNRLYVAKHRSKDECKTDVSIQSKSKSKSKNKEEEIREEEEATTAAKKLTDSEWLEGLGSTSAYKLLDVQTEYAKAQVWAEANRRQCTRRFFVNWLNRAKPMEVTTNGTPKQSFQDRRAELAAESYKRTAEIRQRVEQRDRELSRTALPDYRPVLQPIESDTDGQREGSPVGCVGEGVNGYRAGV